MPNQTTIEPPQVLQSDIPPAPFLPPQTKIWKIATIGLALILGSIGVYLTFAGNNFLATPNASPVSMAFPQESPIVNVSSNSEAGWITYINKSAAKWISPLLYEPLVGDMEVRIEKDSKCFILSFMRDSENTQKSEALFDQILATFKFTN